MIKNFKWLLLASLSLGIACSDDDSDSTGNVPVSPGSADFSKYVALGDSFAAGYSDNALFKRGQENSYPSFLAQQFALVGGGNFPCLLWLIMLGDFQWEEIKCLNSLQDYILMELGL